MKMFALISGALLVCATAGAQTQPLQEDLQAQVERERAKENAAVRPEKPNEISTDTLTYSGIIVQSIKTDNPLQLVNPAAPAEYGSPENNVVRDPITRGVSGLKLFSIKF